MGYVFLYPIFHQCKALSWILQCLTSGTCLRIVIICSCVGSSSEVTCASILLSCHAGISVQVVLHVQSLVVPLQRNYISLVLCLFVHRLFGRQIYNINLLLTFELWSALVIYCVRDITNFAVRLISKAFRVKIK
jgi:hypothetical protein